MDDEDFDETCEHYRTRDHDWPDGGKTRDCLDCGAELVVDDEDDDGGPVVSTMTPAGLYAMEPQSCTQDICDLNGCYYSHIPEINVDGITENTRVEVRVLRHVDYDHRRYWRLATVWFDGQPVMVIQNAGREGDDHARRFVTDLTAYAAMVTYLHSLTPPSVGTPDVVDPNQPRGDLLAFYGDRMILTSVSRTDEEADRG